MLRVEGWVTDLPSQPNALSGSLSAGQVACVLGRNGAGKSWLLRSWVGLQSAIAGQFHGPDSSKRAQWLGYLAQTEDRMFPMQVLDYVLSARTPWLAWHQDYRAEDRQIAEAALSQVGLADYRGRSIQALSGGEWQRVRLAALVAGQSKIWLLDEPTEHLDPGHIWNTLPGLIREHTAAGGAVIMVAHDPDWAAQLSDQCVLLSSDSWSWGSAEDQLTQANLSQLYGHPYECRDGRWLAV